MTDTAHNYETGLRHFWKRHDGFMCGPGSPF